MSPRCTIDLGDGPVQATWSLIEEGQQASLLLSPENGPAEVLDLRELNGIAGDGYALVLSLHERVVSMSKLGADGLTLKGTLWRLWPPIRATTLRLDMPGDQKIFACTVDLGTAGRSGSGWVLVFDHALITAVEGQDEEPIFLSEVSGIGRTSDGFTVECTRWDGTRVAFSRLGPKTDAFADAVGECRARLVATATKVLGGHLPAMPPADRARLASRWLPGRLMSLDELETVVSGATAQLEAGWVRRAPRSVEASTLCSRFPGSAVYAGYTHPGAEAPPPGDTPGENETTSLTATGSVQHDSATQTTPLEDTAESPDPSPESSTELGSAAAIGSNRGAEGPHLWLLVDRGDTRIPRWILENLSTPDYATYRFNGGTELPGLVSHLLSAPQFSREALYLALTDMTGDRSGLAIPARDLAFLRELRARHADRIVHGDLERWRAAMEA